VFLPCDGGTRATPDALHAAAPTADAWREIRIDDPIDGARAFAYLVVADAPPRTDRHYVAYEPRGDLVSTATYRLGMVGALPNYFAVAMGAPLGPNLLDGMRLRAEATLRGAPLHWSMNERVAHHELMAWKTGPVRVVRRSRHEL